MSRKEELLQALQNPNVRIFLDLIAEAEGVKHGYNTGFGNTVIESLADHPRERKAFTQTDGKKNTTTAAGRYQFLADTWDDVAKKLKLTDFGPESQDLAAVELLRRNGALPAIMEGDFETGVAKSGRTWASLPSSTYAQPKKDENFVQNFLARRLPDRQPAAIPQPPAWAAMVQAASVPTPAVTPPLKPGEPAPAASVSASDPDAVSKVMELFAPPPVSAIETPNMADMPLQPQDEQLLAASLEADVRRQREEAQAKFFGEDYVPEIALPAPIEDSISRYLAQL